MVGRIWVSPVQMKMEDTESHVCWTAKAASESCGQWYQLSVVLLWTQELLAMVQSVEWGLG